MLFIQVAMVILAIIAVIAVLYNLDDAVKDEGNGRQNLIIAVLLCILMGLGATTISEARAHFSQVKQQNYALTKTVEVKTMRLEKSLNETIELTRNVQKLQTAYEKEQRSKALVDAQLNTTKQELVVANEKLQKIQKLVEGE